MELLQGYSSDPEENKPSKRERPRFIDDSEGDSSSDEESEAVIQENAPIKRKFGEYISKRDKEVLNITGKKLPCITVENDYLQSLEPPDFLQKMTKKTFEKNKMPSDLIYEFEEHTKLVTAIQWSNRKGHLLASSSLDHTVKIYDVFRKTESILTLEYGNGVRDVKWSKDNKKLLSCSLDKYAHLVDVETGSISDSFKHNFEVTCVCFHPEDENMFLIGSKSAGIVCWDIRSHKVLPHQQYRSVFGEVYDLMFLDKETFISSAEPKQRNSLDKAIIAWDFKAGIRVSNQIYLEGLGCPCLAKHPKDSVFIAQSKGNYIAEFSMQPPYKLNQKKRYEAHHIGLNRIRCCYSPDGAMVLTGSTNGCVYFYNSVGANVMRVMKAHDRLCTDVKYHPLLESTLATCGGDGSIHIYE